MLDIIIREKVYTFSVETFGCNLLTIDDVDGNKITSWMIDPDHEDYKKIRKHHIMTCLGRLLDGK